MREFLMFLLNELPKLLFQPQYGVPVAGPLFLEEQILQIVMVWIFVIYKMRLTRFLVGLAIVAIINRIINRGRMIPGLVVIAFVAVMNYYRTYMWARWGLLLITIVFVVLTLHGVWSAESGHRPRSLHGRTGAWMYRFTYRWMSFIHNDVVRVNAARILVTFCCCFGLWEVPDALMLFS